MRVRFRLVSPEDPGGVVSASAPAGGIAGVQVTNQVMRRSLLPVMPGSTPVADGQCQDRMSVGSA